MSCPYTKSFEFRVEGGQAACVELPAPQRGTLRRLAIKQVDGDLGGFGCEVLDSDDSCEDSISALPSLDMELHRIMPPIVVAGGDALYQIFDANARYQNQDAVPLVPNTPNTRIYLHLLAGGAGDKLFQVAYTIDAVAAL